MSPTPTDTESPPAPPPAPVLARSSARATVGICLALLLLGVAIHGPTVGFEFINFDDNAWVYDNPTVARGLTLEGVARAFDTPVTGHWAPLTFLSHLVVAQCSGLNPAGHHLANLLLHLGASLALFAALRSLTGSLWRSGFVAALFTIHPLNVEAVAWVTERKTVLCGLFFFLALGGYARWVQTRRTLAQYAFFTAAFAAALASKLSALTFPLLLLLLDYWPLQRARRLGDWRALVWEKLPLIPLTLVAAKLAVLFQQPYMLSTGTHPIEVRVTNAITSYATYLRQIIWPGQLTVFYPRISADHSLPTLAISIALLVVISAGVIMSRRKRYLTVGWLWFLGTLFPLIGLLQVGEIAHADRYMYLPGIGLFIALTWAAVDLSRNWPARRALLSVAAVVILGSASVLAVGQVAKWRNPETVWLHALEVTDRNNLAHFNLGKYYLTKGRIHESGREFEASVADYPDWSDSLAALGTYLVENGDRTRAVALLQRAVVCNPKNTDALAQLGLAYIDEGRIDDAFILLKRALEVKPDSGCLRAQHALALTRTGRRDEADAEYQRALQLEEKLPTTHIGYGQLLWQLGRMDDALKHFRRALELAPQSAEAHCGIADARFQQGAVAESIDHYRLALASDPANTTVQANLAWILATSTDPAARSPEEAVRLARAACNATANENPLVLRILAAALAESGDFATAVAVATDAQSRARTMGDTGLAARLEAHLAAYHRGEPIRIPTVASH